MRVRRDEATLRKLFEDQTKGLKEIEDDPEFKRKLAMLQKFGKEIPSYSAPATPQHQEVRKRPAPTPAPTPEKSQSQQNKSQVKTPKKADSESSEPQSKSPRTPKSYTQPVARSTPLPPPPKLVSSSQGGGGLFATLMDLVVGDGPTLGEILTCEKCSANNGIMAKENVPSCWPCSTCGHENRK